MTDLLNSLLGVHTQARDLNSIQMSLRAVVTYGGAILLVRLGHRRFLGKSTPFDVILAIMLGSVLSRAINGQAAFFPTFVASAVMVALHWVISAITFHSDRASVLLEGKAEELVRDGHMQQTMLRRSHIRQEDLCEALHAQGKVERIDQVHLAVLERDGKISVIPKN